MDTQYPTLIHGLIANETYSWDEMESRGWRYCGATKHNLEILELWKREGYIVLVNLDGKIISFHRRAEKVKDAALDVEP
ncbi:hypothetical protein JW998_05885 [candidate division KSB1 bacterium]|nr:hypothetical protein [candidate division KSB1 bacterium]